MKGNAPDEGETEAAASPPLPADAAAWRALFAALPARDLLRLVQEDKPRANRIFAGFRATTEGVLRHPVIVARLIEETALYPKFAREAAALTPAPPRPEPNSPEKKPGAPAAALPAPLQSEDTGDTPLREKLKEQRAALKENGAEIARLKAALTQAERAQNAARVEAEAAHAGRKKAETETERVQRLRDREAKRQTEAGAPLSSTKEAAARRAVASPSPQTSPENAAPSLLEEGLRRLLSQGKYTIVAAVCREALLTGGNGSGGASGPVSALYADALYGLGNDAEGAAQDRRAASGFLDQGQIMAAAESLTRACERLTADDSSSGAAADTALLKRLLGLAERDGQADTAVAAFARLRVTAPPVVSSRVKRLFAAAGNRYAGLLAEAAARTDSIAPPGIDEMISAPGVPGGITARALLHALESGDVGYVDRARAALSALREINPALADALIQAVSARQPALLPPLLQKTDSARPIIVDASNVARHEPDPLALTKRPRVENLLRMRDFLLARGFFPVLLIADANLRFHVDDRAAYEDLVARGTVRETLAGTSADEVLIREARERACTLVTNDRLQEWEKQAQGIERLGFGIFSETVSLMPA